MAFTQQASWSGSILSSYSTRQVLEAGARSGDESSRWALAWAYAEDGKLGKAWGWVGDHEAHGSDQIYFKAWLAWKLGQPASAELALRDKDCLSDACWSLRVNIAWDLGLNEQAKEASRAWYETGHSPQAYYAFALSSLLSKDYRGFDDLEKLIPWREASEFVPWRSAIVDLVKIRANFIIKSP